MYFVFCHPDSSLLNNTAVFCVAYVRAGTYTDYAYTDARAAVALLL
jgi:hypothetical protein